MFRWLATIINGPLDGTLSLLLTTTLPKNILAHITDSIYAKLRSGIFTILFKKILTPFNYHLSKNISIKLIIIVANKLIIIIMVIGL